MAFKGRTTTGYNSKTGKGRMPAKTGGKVSHNPRKPLPGGRTNVVTKATRTGTNPRNVNTNKLNANRVQRAGGLGKGSLKQNQPKANIITPRGKQNFSNRPFTGYNLLTNPRQVPAGRGNIRNQGTVTPQSVSRLRAAHAMKLPKGALTGKTGFGKFMGK